MPHFPPFAQRPLFAPGGPGERSPSSRRRAKTLEELEAVKPLTEMLTSRGVEDDTTPRGGTPIQRGGARATTAYFEQFTTDVEC